ncbi:hypothetical protein [Streptomyces collinus]|uniref:hypothetical protein n=1 Tax=Streptomyces collinus TaxID=42684 RepID=UPI00294348AC|nr:hypothetical protein [Streptomyces collinus]
MALSTTGRDQGRARAGLVSPVIRSAQQPASQVVKAARAGSEVLPRPSSEER